MDKTEEDQIREIVRDELKEDRCRKIAAAANRKEDPGEFAAGMLLLALLMAAIILPFALLSAGGG